MRTHTFEGHLFFFKGKCRKKGKSYDKETTAITRTYDSTFKFRSQSDYKNIYIQNILSNYFSFRERKVKAVIFSPSHYTVGINGEAAISGSPSHISGGPTPVGRGPTGQQVTTDGKSSEGRRPRDPQAGLQG